MDFAARLVGLGGLAAGRGGAPDHVVAEPGPSRPARCGRPLLSAVPAQPDAAGALSAPHRGTHARRAAALSMRDRADGRRPVHGRTGAADPFDDKTPGRGAAAPDPA